MNLLTTSSYGLGTAGRLHLSLVSPQGPPKGCGKVASRSAMWLGVKTLWPVDGCSPGLPVWKSAGFDGSPNLIPRFPRLKAPRHSSTPPLIRHRCHSLSTPMMTAASCSHRIMWQAAVCPIVVNHLQNHRLHGSPKPFPNGNLIVESTTF